MGKYKEITAMTKGLSAQQIRSIFAGNEETLDTDEVKSLLKQMIAIHYDHLHFNTGKMGKQVCAEIEFNGHGQTIDDLLILADSVAKKNIKLTVARAKKNLLHAIELADMYRRLYLNLPYTDLEKQIFAYCQQHNWSDKTLTELVSMTDEQIDRFITFQIGANSDKLTRNNCDCLIRAALALKEYALFARDTVRKNSALEIKPNMNP